ncbi:phage tail protein [Mucilaginibacter antarcticus]|uniref:Phage tail protein n=1 Tax=Mucilaginibacter antarcticus TaxID=1855725 RepID=A0ABW5XJW2_9SPHI
MEAYMSSILLFAAGFEPVNWMFCDGRLLDIQNNTALFALLGTQYGGDGIKNFALPNLNTDTTGPAKYIICTSGLFPSRQ